MRIAPKKGGNLRLKPYDVGPNQWALMQNVDMDDAEEFPQIHGSVKWHGGAMDDHEPTAIMVNYNESENKEDVLVAIFDKIYKKNFGENEMEELINGLTPNSIRFSVSLRDKTYVGNKKDGLYEFDGIGVIAKIDNIKLKDIIIAKETNRAFGITADNEIVWTDDLATIGGVPIKWNALNVDRIPPTDGDVPEKLFILNGRLMILMTQSAWIYYINGSPANWRPEQLPIHIGCIAPKTAKRVGSEIWFLGFSPQTKRGVYAVNSSGQARRLSYDYQPFMDRINDEWISEACAEFVDNLYKLSVAIDSSQVNNRTLHFDTIRVTEDGSPNIYGPHTYGFNCSAVLNTRKFKGEHLFGRKHSDGGRIFKVSNYATQYSNELEDDGELIQSILLSAIFDTETIGKNTYNATWIKGYSNIFAEYPPKGAHQANLEILKGYENETFESFEQYLEGNDTPLEAIIADEDAINNSSLGIDQHLTDFESDAIQLKITNSNTKKRFCLRALSYDAAPVRRKKHVQKVSL